MSQELFPLFGIVPSINTPFTENDAVDFVGLQKHIDYAIGSGVRGMMLPVVASEVGKLTPEEREKIVKAAVEANANRTILIGGASAPTGAERLQNVGNLIRAGVDGVLVQLVFENERQYEEEVRAIAALEPRFLMIQDFDLAGRGTPQELLLRLFEEIPCFRCLKIETSPAGPKYTAMIEGSGNRLNVSGGWAVMQLIEALDRGVHAMVPTGLHEIYCKIYELYQAGRREKAVVLYERLQPILAFSNQHLDISLHFFKHLLHRQGLYQTPKVREPVLAYDPYFRRIGDEMIEKAIALIVEVNDGSFD